MVATRVAPLHGYSCAIKGACEAYGSGESRHSLHANILAPRRSIDLEQTPKVVGNEEETPHKLQRRSHHTTLVRRPDSWANHLFFGILLISRIRSARETFGVEGWLYQLPDASLKSEPLARPFLSSPLTSGLISKESEYASLKLVTPTSSPNAGPSAGVPSSPGPPVTTHFHKDIKQDVSIRRKTETAGVVHSLRSESKERCSCRLPNSS